jgi:ACR3 family arsenite transporter
MLTSVDTDLIRILADPLRLRIVTLLARETLCTTHLVEETGARQANLLLLAGFLTRRIGEQKLGREAYESSFLPKIGPWALYGLLFTIVILFALQGKTITSQPLDVARIALPLLVYFAVMWFGTFALGKAVGLAYDRTATLAFTAAGNNFELAIAVAIATFGVTSGQALSGVVGPLIEVPVLVALVYVSLAWRRKFTAGRQRMR